MNYYLHRACFGPSGTYGIFTDPNSNPICLTCELPWENNEPQISCIPAASYSVVQFLSPSKGQVWQLIGVPGRSNILIHQGNTEHDSEGCILVGNQFGMIDGMLGVLNSIATLNKLRSTLPHSFTMFITN